MVCETCQGVAVEAIEPTTLSFVARPLPAPPAEVPKWTFLTNHAHVLICIADNPEVRMRDVATRVAVTERAAQRIVSEPEEAGYRSHDRAGRCNRYMVHTALPLRHPIEQHCLVASLLKPILGARRTA